MALRESPRGIMELARQKVMVQGPSYLTALLSYRLIFYITNNAIAEDLVSGWLRYILYINEGRDLLLTCQPSEPVLAHTSAVQMLDPATRVQVLQQFARISFEGSINTGDMGEIVAAIILFFTYDEVLYSEAHEFPAAVPFQGFITCLFGCQVAGQIMECSSTDTEMALVCSDGKVFCNHFFKIEEDPTSKTLEDAFLRGAGIILPDQFPGANLLVPIRLPERQMTFFGIQVKNRARDSYSGSLKEETIRSFSNLSKRLGMTMPFVKLTMALKGGERTNQTQSAGIVYPLKPTGHSTRRATPASTEYDWPRKNKRLLLLAVGLEYTVYPSIGRCMGQNTPESESLFPLLNTLLNCKPGVTLPTDADLGYADRVRSLDI